MNTEKYRAELGKQYVKFSYLVKNRGDCITYADRGLYRTEDETIRVFIDSENFNEYIDIPPHYYFDFGSVPSWAHWICNKDEYMAFLAHDRFFDRDCEVVIKDIDNLSETFKKLQKFGTGFEFHRDKRVTFRYNRKFGDRFMLQLIRDENRNILQRNNLSIKIQEILVYLSVRIGGARNFRKRNYNFRENNS